MAEHNLTSRRQFLKGLLFASGAVALGACTPVQQSAPAEQTQAEEDQGGQTAAEAAEPEQAEAVDVTLRSAGWPIVPLPTAEDIAADPRQAAYGEALQVWLGQNPGVTIEAIELDIWTQENIVSAISGGVAPSWFFAPTVGGWTLAGTRAAFVQGLIADCSAVVEKYGLKAKLADYALVGWESNHLVNGKYLSFPFDVGVNGTMFYRRDLIQELGLEEPAQGWTWDDLRTLAKDLTSEADGRKGMAGDVTLGFGLGSHGFDLLSNLPAPDATWHWQRDFSNSTWAEIAQAYREMVFEDESVLVDATFGGAEYQQAFVNGSVAIMSNNVLGYFGPASEETSFAALAKRLDKPVWEVVGIAERPRGTNGYFVGGVYTGGVSFPPDASATEIDKAAGAVDFMFLGEGWKMQKIGQWETTKDPQSVFNYPLPATGDRTLEGVPSSFEEAWGQVTLDSTLYIANIPLLPDPGNYLPAEANQGPDNQAIDDAWSQITSVADDVDIAGQLQTAQDIWNQQAAGFASSINAADFKSAAQTYYADVDAFWQTNSPEFHSAVFKPWYESQVLPAIS